MKHLIAIFAFLILWQSAPAARAFVGASNQFISVGSIPTCLTAGNTRTVAFKFRVSSPSTRQTMFLVGAISESGNNRFDIEVYNSHLAVSYYSAIVESTTTIVADTWYHAIVAYNSGSLAIYVNGTVESTTSVALSTGSDRFNIGAFVSGYQPMTGELADLAIYAGDVGAFGRTSLAAGAPPCSVRPELLEAYIPFVRDLNDVVGALALTDNNGSTTADHPRTYR